MAMSGAGHSSSDGKRVAGKAPEKSNFAQTCNLLSQFLKVKGNFRDLNLEISGRLDAIGKPETSANMFHNNMEQLGQSSTQHVRSAEDSSLVIVKEDVSNKAISIKSAATTTEFKGGQMTIFYAGKVYVFNDFPAEKVRDVLQLAGKPKNTNNVGFAFTSNAADQKECRPDLNAIQPISADPAAPAKDGSGDLPIARRASLHRFLEKRKDRAVVRAPYQLQNPNADGSSGQDEQLELKL